MLTHLDAARPGYDCIDMAATPVDQHEGIKRFLADLRSGFDRRAWSDRRKRDRRAGPAPVRIDRRSRPDRRSLERRNHDDRRRSEFQSFSRDEMIAIREMLHGTREPVTCPKCGGNLLLALPAARGAKTPHAVQCTSCRGRMAIESA